MKGLARNDVMRMKMPVLLGARKRLRAEDSDSGESSASAGSHVASSREVDRVRLSQKNPGCLLRSAEDRDSFPSRVGDAGNIFRSAVGRQSRDAI